MARKGPPPTPTALKVIRGNPGKRPLNDREPQPPPPSSLDAPGDLSDAAKLIWHDMAPKLSALNLLGSIDVRALARACRLEALGLEQLRISEETGPTQELKGQGRTVAAEFSVAMKSFDAADRIWFRFGITPAERSRLKTVEPEKPKSKWEGLLGG